MQVLKRHFGTVVHGFFHYPFQAAILQQTAEYIYTLEQEKTRLLSQNSQLKRLLSLSQQRLEGQTDDTSPRIKKKRMAGATTSIEGATNELKHEEEVYSTTGLGPDLNLQLIQEQRLRLKLEERLKSLEHHLGPGAQTVNTQPPQATVTLAAAPTTLLPTHPLKMVSVTVSDCQHQLIRYVLT